MKLSILGVALPTLVSITTALIADPGWPRVFTKDGKELTIYQPQVDYWRGYTNLHFRCAIAVKGVSKEEKFGVAEVDALTVTDHDARVVAISPLKREVRFGHTPEPELTALRTAANQLHPMGQVTTLSIDRLVAYLDPATQPVQQAVELNLDPPKIFSSATPAILVIITGEPIFRPVETNRTDLLFALNTNWDLLHDTASRQYYLLNGEGWLTAPDVLKGPWTAAQNLPPSIYSLPANENWTEARKHLPGKPSKKIPTVFASAEPAEMILTDGPPKYSPVAGTQLARMNNTDSVLFLHADGELYFLVAGRWFRGSSLNGPWTAASGTLPPDFAKIPDDDPSAFVKATVPGTREAKDAVLLASIPTTTTIGITNVTLNVTYGGPPQFVPITNTVVQYAANSPNQVFLVSGSYYCCAGGVWYCGAGPTGPWSFCTTVPPAIYTIPPSNPNYNVTYVTVQSATPTTVTYSQTSGYKGEYVAPTGVLMFGMGMLAGAAIAKNNNCDYCYYPPPPCYYSYGRAVTYNYGYAGYYGGSYAAYGPYGGAGYAAGYNPYTGTYARSSYAYGPYGSAGGSAAYNPYTGGYGAGGQVNSAYGSAGRAAGYNPYTGTYAAGGSASTAYGSASRGAAYNENTGARAAGGQVNTAAGSAGRAAGYNPTTGQGAAGGYRSGAAGSAGAATTTRGGSAAAWDTQNSQGAVGKTSSGDVYASNGDSVYKKNQDGSWSKNSGSGWESAESPQGKAQSQGSARSQQAQAQGGSAQQSAQTQASARQQQAQAGAGSAQAQAQSQGSARSQQAQAQGGSAQQSAQTQASTRQQQAQAGAGSAQAQAQSRAGAASGQGGSASAASSNWSQQRSSMEGQAQARQSGNQQAARASQSRASGGGRR